jgi:hypothetical protein
LNMFKAMIGFGAAPGSRLLCIGKKIFQFKYISYVPRVSNEQLLAKTVIKTDLID